MSLRYRVEVKRSELIPGAEIMVPELEHSFFVDAHLLLPKNHELFMRHVEKSIHLRLAWLAETGSRHTLQLEVIR